MATAHHQPLSERWSVFASELEYGRLPGELLLTLKSLLLDTVGVSLAASTLGPCGSQAIALARAQSGPGDCLILGQGARVSCLMAGLANGTLAHALNFDAMGAQGGHVGVATVPAPLAMAQWSGGISGADFLVALALGAEFTTRLAASLNGTGLDVHEKFLEGQILGVFGAAIGAGKVRRLDARQMHDLLGLALMQASGTRQVSLEGGAGKAMAGGFANHAGLFAAFLAAEGVDARCEALEGRAGLYALFYEGKYRRASISDKLGEEFASIGTVFKPWPTSGVVHPFIAASLELRKAHRLDAASIASVHIAAGEASRAWLFPERERRCPDNGATAANSIFFGVAKALANGRVTIEDLSDEGLVEPTARALATSMSFVIDPDMGRGARVRVTTRDGMTFSASAEATPVQLGFGEIAEKFRLCAGHAARPISNSAIDAIIENVYQVEKLSDISQIFGLFDSQ